MRACQPEDAIYQACLLRFRPIMMTTMAALLGGCAASSWLGRGSELRRPLGITIIGGLIFSQLLTLYTTPVIYLWFDRLATRFSPSAESPANSEPFRKVIDEYFRSHLSGGPWPQRCWWSPWRWRAPWPYRLLPVSPLPEVDFPTISVSAACPELVRKRWHHRWPRRSNGSSARIAGVTEMTSSSGLGSTCITLAIRSESRHRRGRARCSSRD